MRQHHPASNSPPIVVEGVSKQYSRRWLPWRNSASANQPYALKDVSFTVEEGETVGLLGPNGAGKTTLLKTIATLLSPSSGRVLIYGRNAASDSLWARSQMGLVTCDERSFYWRLSGRHNLMFFATLYGVPRAEAAPRVQMLLEVLDLARAAHQPFHSYSSGMKQKLAIARGLLGHPSILLYDEPTRSLDPLSARNIRNWIIANRSASPRTAHLIATNQLHEAEQLCDRIVILSRGVAVAQGTVQDIREKQQRTGVIHRITCRGFDVDGDFRAICGDGLFDVTEEKHDADYRTLRVHALESSSGLSRLLDAILRSGGTIVRCEVERLPFDEVFCSLVAGEGSESSATTGESRS